VAGRLTEDLVRTAITLADFVWGDATEFLATAEQVVAAERLGVDTVWSAEAWGTDGVVPLAYLAAVTNRIRLATGILQVTARAASMTAMTAMTLDRVSNGRFVLGLGVSGPQVVEGLHGVPYARPLERLRETVDVVRLAVAGKRLEYQGNQLVLPRPGGEGRALRIGQPPRPDLPIHLATLGPQALRYTGAAADGWVGTCFVPERSDYFLSHLPSTPGVRSPSLATSRSRYDDGRRRSRSSSARWGRRRRTSTTTPTRASATRRRRDECASSGWPDGTAPRRTPFPTSSRCARRSSAPTRWCARASARIATPV